MHSPPVPDHAFGRSRLRKSCHVSVSPCTSDRLCHSLQVLESVLPTEKCSPQRSTFPNMDAPIYHFCASLRSAPRCHASFLSTPRGMKGSMVSGVEQSRSQTVGSGEPIWSPALRLKSAFATSGLAFRMGVSAVQMSLLSDGTGYSLSSCLRRPSFTFLGATGEALECRDSSKPTPSNPAFTLCCRLRAKPICNFSNHARNPVRKAPPPFPRITASARQSLKLPRPLPMSRRKIC